MSPVALSFFRAQGNTVQQKPFPKNILTESPSEAQNAKIKELVFNNLKTFLETHSENKQRLQSHDISFKICGTRDEAIYFFIENVRVAGIKEGLSKSKISNVCDSAGAEAGERLNAGDLGFTHRNYPISAVSQSNIYQYFEELSQEVHSTLKRGDVVASTVYHELCHNFGSFKDEWLNEAVTDWIAVNALFESEKNPRYDSQYTFARKAFKRIVEEFEISKKEILRAYTSRDDGAFIRILQSKGISDSDRARIFELGQKTMPADLDQKPKPQPLPDAYDDFLNHIKQIKLKISRQNEKADEQPESSLPPKADAKEAKMDKKEEERDVKINEIQSEHAERMREQIGKTYAGANTETDRYIENLWTMLQTIYPGHKGKVRKAPLHNILLPEAGSELFLHLKNSPNAITTWSGDETVIVINKVRLGQNQCEGRDILDAVFSAYLSDQWTRYVGDVADSSATGADSRLLVHVTALYSYFRKDLYNQLGIDSVMDEAALRSSVIGEKLVRMLGEKTAEHIIFQGNADELSGAFRTRFGEDAVSLLERGHFYFENPDTTAYLTLYLIENLGNARQDERAALFEPLSYNQFEKEFLESPYTATYKLMSYAVPNLPPYYRSELTSCSLVYLKEKYGKIRPEAVASLALTLSTAKQGSHAPLTDSMSGLFFDFPDKFKREHMSHIVNLHVINNMLQDADSLVAITNGLGSSWELKAIYDSIPEVADLGGRYESEVLLSLSTALANRELSRKFTSFTLTTPSALDGAYAEQQLEAASQYYRHQSSYAAMDLTPETISGLVQSTNQVLNEFALECARLQPEFEVGYDKITGVLLAELPNGLIVPSLAQIAERFGESQALWENNRLCHHKPSPDGKHSAFR